MFDNIKLTFLNFPKTDFWFGVNTTNFQISAGDYVTAVTTSKVAVNLQKYNIAVGKATINKIREQSKVKCLGVKTPCNLLQAPCLYDINNDPCEETNLAPLLPDKLAELTARFNDNLASTVLPGNLPPGNYLINLKCLIIYRVLDARCDPVHFNYTWTWWAQDIPEYI